MHYSENNVNIGCIKDIEEICVDHFVGDDLKATSFFLSHAHTDHMVGLDKQPFLDRLDEPGIRLYCHNLTPMLVGNFARYLKGKEGIEDFIRRGKIVPLDAEIPQVLRIPRGHSFINVTVTLLPAGHCPGSVMFLFETEWRRILYTADFRLNLADIKGIEQLHIGSKPNQILKPLDLLYIDTTFCCHTAESFPDRKLALEEAIGHLNEWITSSSFNLVKIEFAARFAHEYILKELYKRFSKRVHVDAERFALYQQIPGLEACVTLEGNTPFHFCRNKTCFDGQNYLNMKLTSMWYTSANIDTRTWVSKTGSMLKVCYAMHSSLGEVAAIIDYLKPQVVVPLVNPVKDSLTEVGKLLKQRCAWDFDYFEDVSEADLSSPRKYPTFPSRQSKRKDSGSSTSYDSPVKKSKPSEDNEWDYALTPSPKLGCSSGSSRDNSQELMLDSQV